MNEKREADIVVVGGGLAGLTAAIWLARAGRSVTLFDRSRHLGGRARTQAEDAFLFNQGPHALYRSGRGLQVLRELGIDVRGRAPAAAGDAIRGGKLHRLPSDVRSLLTTSLLGLRGKLEAGRLLATIGRIEAKRIDHLTVEQWLTSVVHQADVRQLMVALLRLTTYGADPRHESAGAALAQLQMALRDNVLYLDGGWQTLVDGLERAARAAGVQIVTGTRVVEIQRDESVHGVRLDDGTTRAASAVIVAGSPDDVCSLVQPVHKTRETVLRDWADQAAPVTMACLDVALDHLPRPRRLFALGVDRSLYCSVHSATARLAPPGGALVHTAKYLGTTQKRDARADEHELEVMLDLVQPGWRGALVHRRFLPRMVVSNALVTAEQGGLAGRPGPAVPGIANLYVAGDWVGQEGMLVDASLASATRAAELILAAAATPPVAATSAAHPRVADVSMAS